MAPFRKLLAFVLCVSSVVYAAESNTFTKVRYNGGSVASHVDPKDWNNKLTVTSDAITLETKDNVKVSFPPKSVTSLSYGQEAHRRVGTMVALAILVSPVALFGLFHKTRLHYIGIQYNTPDGKSAGILLQGDKDNYRAMLVSLQGVSGAPVSVGEKVNGPDKLPLPRSSVRTVSGSRAAHGLAGQYEVLRRTTTGVGP